MSILENKICKKTVENYMEIQQGDVKKTYTDTPDLKKVIGFRPSTSIEDGL